MLDPDKYVDRAAAQDPDFLFLIQRNQNKNAVGYSFRKNADVQAQWFEFEADPTGGTRSDLTELERMTAYGFSQKGVTFRMKAMPDHVLHVGKNSAGRHVAVMGMEGGRQVVVRRVWVQLKRWLGLHTPQVDFVEVVGTDMGTGAEVRMHMTAASKNVSVQ